MPGGEDRAMATYVIYTRVSTEDQARQGFSLPEQAMACRRRAEQLSQQAADPAPAIVAFTDNVSGDYLERPGLTAALALVRAGQVAAFICMDPDRLARKLLHQLLVTDEIDQGGCKLEFVDHDYRQDPEGQLFYQIRGSVAQYEKAKILQRMARGARGKARAGGVPTYVHPYGYAFRAGQGHAPAIDVIVPSAEEAPWVEAMFHWCAEEGLGPRRIATRLNDLGVPAKHGGRWDHNVVRRILRNPTYATGGIAWGRQDHRGIYAARRLPSEERRRRHIRLTPVPRTDQATMLRVTPLLSQDLWDRVQDVLAGFRLGDRAQNDPRRQRLLTGLGRCGECGSRLMYYSGRKMSCQGRLAGNGCQLPSKPAAAVEAAVWAHVQTWLAEGLTAVAPREPSPPADRVPPHQERAALEDLITHKRQEVERWGRLFAEGRVPESIALPALARTQAAWREAEQRLATITAPQGRPPATPRAWTETLARARAEGLATERSEAQRIVLTHSLVDHFIMGPSPRRAPPPIAVIAVWDRDAHPAPGKA